MTRAEYMEELAQALKAYDEDFALDIIGITGDISMRRLRSEEVRSPYVRN